jgi:phage terminase large subunit
MEIRINYVPNDWARPLHESNIRHACCVGGLGSGKSVAAWEEIKALALENPGFTYLIGRKTLPSLRDTTLKTVFSRMEDGLQKTFNQTHLTLTLVNGSQILFRPLDDPEKMKSLEIAGFFVDEANEIDQDMYNTLKSRVRQKVQGKEPTMYRTIIALNPTEEDHWIPQLFLHNCPPGSKMFTSTTLDNLKNLPDGYVEELKRMYSKDMQQRMIYGLFGKVHKGRPVYPQFQRGQYVFDVPYDPTLPLIRGWDFGYNRPACVWLQMKKNQIRVLAEMLGKEVYLDDFVKDTVLPYQMSLFGEQRMKILDFCDPRGADQSDKGKTSVQMLNELGIYPAYRRTWIEEGIKAVKQQLDTVDPDTKENNFLIHPRCKTLIEGFNGGYHRESGEETPVKDDFYDHLQDALRYALLHCVQRAKISGLMKEQQKAKIFVNPHTGRRLEF